MKAHNKKFILILFILTFLILVLNACTISNVNNEQSYEKNVNFSEVNYDISMDVDLNNNEIISYDSEKEITVIIKLKQDSLIDGYFGNKKYQSLQEYLLSEDGNSLVKTIEADQAQFIDELNQCNIEYSLEHTYSAIFNGLAIKIKLKDYNEIKGLSNIDKVSEAIQYNLCSTDTNEVTIKNNNNILFDDNGLLINNSKYQGEGMVMAVIDTGVDINHPAFSKIPANPNLCIENLAPLLPILSAGKTISGNNYYISEKIPFVFDYADMDTNPIPSDEILNKKIGMEHGTHVAGIMCGNDEVINSAAPEAQLVAMKVADDTNGRLLNSTIIAAINDAIVIGVDAINMSFGSANGPVVEYGAYDFMDDVYTIGDKLGIALCAAVGNDGSAACAAGGNLSSNPDSGVVGAPASYPSTFAIGSYDRALNEYFIYNNKKIQYINARDENSNINDFLNILLNESEKEIEYITLKYGLENEYDGIDASNKLVLVQRGEISFSEKMQYAINANALGLIIYNNENTTFRCQVNNLSIFCISISMEDGINMAKQNAGTITIKDNLSYIPNSYFSSKGPTNTLDIGVDISAPGGNIYSSIPLKLASIIGASKPYAYMSGTSMATPNACAEVLIVKQYLKSKYPQLTNKELLTLTYRILMSTADINRDYDGNIISPRKQGAGFMNLDAAINANAYLYVTGEEKTKINLGSDKEKAGIYTLLFNIVNTSKEELQYNINPMMVIDKIVDNRISDYFYNEINEFSWEAYQDGKSVNNIIVNPESTSTIKIVLKLNNEFKQYLNINFVNGTYIEGYVQLNNENEKLNIPYISFYGDWSSLPLFEPTAIESKQGKMKQIINANLEASWNDNISEAFSVRHGYSIGCYNEQFVLPDGYTNPLTTADYGAIGVNSAINKIYTGFLRNIEKCEIQFIDEFGIHYYINEKFFRLSKNYYLNTFNEANMRFDFVDINANTFNWANNQLIKMQVKAYWDDSEDIYQILEFPFYIDIEAPIMNNISVEKDSGNIYLNMDVYDNHYLMNYAFYMKKDGKLIALENNAIPVYNFNKNEINKMRCDISKYTSIDGNLILLLRDYALNTVQYEIDLSAYLNTDSIDSFDVSNIDYYDYTENNTQSLELHITSQSINEININSENTTDEKFNIVNGKLISYTGTDSVVVLPDDVKIIDAYVFHNKATVHEVKLNEGLEVIGKNAFSYCRNLRKISIPSTLQKIDDYAFEYCRSLEELNLEPCKETLSYIGIRALNLIGVEELDIPDFTQNVEYAASMSLYLEKCKIFTFRDQISDFYNVFPCMPLCKVLNIYGTLNYSQKKYSLDFNYLPSVETINFYGDQQNIGVETINSTNTLCSIQYGYSLHNMTSLKEVNFYGNVDAIKGTVFNACPELEKVTFYKNLGELGVLPFTDCPKLKEFNVSADNEYLFKDEESKIVFNKDKTKMFMPTNWTYNGIFKIPESVTQLQAGQFGHYRSTVSMPIITLTLMDAGYSLSCINTSYNNEYNIPDFKGVILHSNIKKIPDLAFSCCQDMDTIIYNDANITEWGHWALYNTGITELILSDATETLGSEFVASCKNLKKLEINASIKNITAFSVSKCESLETLDLPAKITGAILKTSAFGQCSSLKSVKFNTKITSLPVGCFAFTPELKTIEGLGTLRVIPIGCFSNCGIESFEFPRSIMNIMQDAFKNSGLKSITINEGCRVIYPNAFANCENLTSVYLSSTISKMPALTDVFANCPSLASIEISPRNKLFKAVDGIVYNLDMSEILYYPVSNTLAEYDVPDSIKVITDNVFSNVKNLKKINLNNVTEIGYAAFMNSSIETVEGNNLMAIGTAAFMDAKSLKYINMENIQLIYDYAFANTSLQNVELNNIKKLGNNAFEGINMDKLTISSNCINFDFGIIFYKSTFNSIYSDNSNFLIKDNALYSQNQKVMYRYWGNEQILNIPEGVEKISDEMATNNNYLVELVLPSTIKVVGDRAFYNCSKLNKLTIKAEFAPRLLSYRRGENASIEELYQNFGIGKLEIICNNNSTYNTPVWNLYK